MATATLFKDANVSWTTATGGAYTEIPDVKSVEVPLSKAELANSVMGDSAETFFPGLVSAPINITCRQSFAAGGVDSVAWTKWNSETRFDLRIRPVDALPSTTNPQYVFKPCSVFSITPVSGAHGQLLDNVIAIRLLSGGTVTRSTDS